MLRSLDMLAGELQDKRLRACRSIRTGRSQQGGVNVELGDLAGLAASTRRNDERRPACLHEHGSS